MSGQTDMTDIVNAIHGAAGDIIKALREEPQEQLEDAPDPATELDAAKQFLRVDVAKRALPALIVSTAGINTRTEGLVEAAYAIADIFVAKAFAPAAPITEPSPEESES